VVNRGAHAPRCIAACRDQQATENGF